MMGNITDFLKQEARTDTIMGQQFQLGEFSCIPVMSVGLGFGGGGGEGKSDAKVTGGEGTGAGGGAGLGMGPVGFLVTRGDTIQFISTRNSRGLSAAMEKLPELMNKVIDQRNGSSAKAEASVA